MKRTAMKKFQSLLSLLLVLCMVSSLPLTALAADTDSTSRAAVSGVSDVNGDGVVTYVAFGDSVTNGYGMEGYRFEDGTNVFGFQREPAASYPALIRDYLTNRGMTVDLKQLAISGFRMDELHWMLSDAYEADEYHDYFFANWNNTVVSRLMSKDADFKAQYGSQYDGTVASANKIIMNEYRNAVKKADLITIDLGTNNFGTFVTNTIQDIIFERTPAYQIDFTQYMDEKTAASLEALLGQMIANMVGANSGTAYDLALKLARCLMFGYLGYTYHYDKAIDAVYALNPNAKVVVVDCYSMITGVELAGGALGENLDLDQLYNLFIDLANFYSRELSPYANVVTHASLDSAPELFIDYYKDYPDADYPDNQNLHPSAERLMNEFIMEMLGYDPDYPDEREQFNQDVLNSIKLLDTYVNDLQNTVTTQVIEGTIKPQIDAAVKDVENQVNTAITAIDLVYAAVAGEKTSRDNLPVALAGVATAEDAVDTAVDGVALSQSIVNLLLTNLIDHSTYGSLFDGSATSSMIQNVIIGEIENQITDELMIQAGFEATEENRAALAQEAYYMACVYKDEVKSSGDRDTANRLAVIEGIRYMLVTAKGYSAEDAQTTAVQAWQINAVVEAEGRDAAIIAALSLEVGEDTAKLAFAMANAYNEAIAAGAAEADAENAAVIAGIAGGLTEDNMNDLAAFGITNRDTAAQMVYKVATLYNTTYAVNNSDKEAVVTCLIAIASELGLSGIDETTASNGYDLYTGVYAPAVDAGKTDAEARVMTIVAAIKTQYPAEGLAEAIYAVYAGNATVEQEQLAYITLMVGSGIPENIAVAIFACYANDLDGQYNNENVKLTMIFLMMQGMGMDQQTASDNYADYLTYKNLPTTLSKIAKCDTIYFDALLSSKPDLNAIAQKFMDGTLKLDEPAANASAEEWAAYKSDSALATLYFRFMTQDGIFTHPSEAGQKSLYNAVKSVLSSILTAEPDSEILVTEDTELLVLGDFIAASENGYVTALGKNLGIAPNNLSNADFRINDVRAQLDRNYSGDAYTASLNVRGDYTEAVKNSDVIILHLGSMNMAMIAKQLGRYMTDGSTYSMEFSTIDSMDHVNLGATVDGLLANFSGAFGQDATGALMLAFESYGYGYTTFADCLDNTVETIQKLNPQADIVLVGMYDLMGDSYIYDSTSGLYLEMGDFIGHAVNLMNQHMENYAAMTDNVTYVDMSGIETYLSLEGPVNLMANGVDSIANAFTKAAPTADGHASIAAKLSCHLGQHTVGNEAIVWTWANDHSEATASFHCMSCDSAVTVQAEVTVESSATCTEAGKLTSTATFAIGETIYQDIHEEDAAALGHNIVADKGKDASCTEPGLTDGSHCDRCGKTLTAQTEIPALGHTWDGGVVTKEPTEETAGVRTYTCENCGDTKTEEIPKEDHTHQHTATVTAPTCTEAGYTTYTCKCGDSYRITGDAALGHNEIADNSKDATCTETGLTDGSHCDRCGEVLVAQEEIPALGHSWDDGVVTKEPTEEETGIRTFTCTVCQETKTEAIPALNHEHQYTSSVTKATCTEAGYTTYTCACGHSYTEAGAPATGHMEILQYAVEATCTETGLTEGSYCNVCNEVLKAQEEIAALGHVEIIDEGFAATCTETGLTDGSHCERCNEVVTAQEEIAALGHDWQDATCTDPKICKVCGASEGSALGHSWDEGIVTKEPTEEETGARTYTCVVCQETKTEEIPCLNPEYSVSRIYGEDRVETAIAVADKLKEVLQVETFDTIILAVGDDFADALTGSYLANAKNAPILLYRANGMEQNEAYIQENLSKNGVIYILGGTAAIPANVEERLVAAGYNVQRLEGESRFETNLKILEAAGVANQEILICTGWDYADSMAASATGLPIVMVNTKLDTLTESQIAFFQQYADNQFTIVGGTVAVSEKLESDIEAIVGDVDRVYGQTREETAAAIASHYFDDPACVLIAYSRNFPDGLCGGVLSYAMKAPLLLVNEGTETAAANYVAEKSIAQSFILGGTIAVSDESIAIIFPN